MLLTIHDSNLQAVAFVDNDKQGTLNYYNDTWFRSLETGSSTFEFTVFKKSIQGDKPLEKAYQTLNERSFVSFRYKGRPYLFSVMTIEETEYTIKCFCENLNLELINEYTNSYKSDRARTFKEYCEVMGITSFAKLEIGINEVSNLSKKLEWEGQETKLARLLSLAKKFDAEIEFSLDLEYDNSIKNFYINIYREHDDEHQGVGKRREDTILTYGKNIRGITRKVDKTGVYSMVRPTGRPDEGEGVITIAGLEPLEIKNKSGVVEFYSRGEALYAPISAQLFPSTFTSKTQNDQWIRKDLEVESSSPKTIRAAGLRNLKKNAYPAITYEIEGFFDGDIGDTFRIMDTEFKPSLTIEARIFEQTISFSDPKNNKTKFGNFKALENQLSSGITETMNRLLEQSLPYKIEFVTTNGLILGDNETSRVTPTLYKGNKLLPAATWRWEWKGQEHVSMEYTVNGSDVQKADKLVAIAYIGNTEVFRQELFFSKLKQGSVGPAGPQGPAGPKGEKGDAGLLDEAKLKELTDKIDSKADDVLTQDQLNALYEKQQIADAELQAKASAAEFSEWVKRVQEFAQADEKGRKKLEEDLIRQSNRVIAIQQDLGEMKSVTNFVTTYMAQSEEGLTIGKKNGSSAVKVSNDRISFVSSGKEVAYISQGVLRIDNGVFVRSLRVGRYVTEQYVADPDINVVRYVGGI